MNQLGLFCRNAARGYDPGMLPTCSHCGGTGDKWDEDIYEWAWPREDCECCNGNGEH